MKAVEKQKSAGQSLWLDHLSRQPIRDGSVASAIEQWSITGMVCSPQAMCQALSATDAYDQAIAKKLRQGMYGPPLIYRLIFEDVRQAADLLRAVHDKTDGRDGWAVLPVSPLFRNEHNSLVTKYKKIWAQIKRPNVLLLLPALADHLSEVEELVFSGMPINIDNVYSAQQFAAVAQACLAGIERRLQAGESVGGSIFISIDIGRLVLELRHKVTPESAQMLALATARKIYRTLHELHSNAAWCRAIKTGLQPLRLIWTHCGDSQDNCSFYGGVIASCSVIALSGRLISRFIVATVDDAPMPVDGGDCDQLLNDAIEAGLDVESEADGLQHGYLGVLAKDWARLLESVASRSAMLSPAEILG